MCINLHRTFRGFAAICGATLAVGGAAALSNDVLAQAPAAAPAAPTATPWTYQGLFDMYFLYDGNDPKGGTGNVTGLEYPQEASTPTLSLAELNIAKAAPAAGGVAFKSTFIAGETAGENVVGAREGRYQSIQQLYVSYVEKSGAGLDFGKFYTPFGYEVTESNANYNYSRSFIFEDLLPVYHTGIRVYTPSYKGLVFTGYIVRSILNGDLGTGEGEGVYDNNKSAGYIGQVNYAAPSGKYTFIETYGGSADGSNGSQDKLLLSDTDLTITPDAVDTFGLNYTNRQDSISGEGSEANNGYAGYYRRQVTPAYAVAFRAEQIDTKASVGSTSEPKVDSLTATLEDKATKSLLLRLEYRHDDAKSTSYGGSILQTGFTGGPGTVSTQNTVSLSAVYSFGP